MWFYVALAFKNLRRHGKRTLIAASAIAVGLIAYLAMDSLLQGADRQSEFNLLAYETGALRIYSPEGAKIRDRLNLKNPLSRSAEIKSALETAAYSVTPRISIQAELVLSDPRYDSPTSTIVRAIAIDTVGDEKVFPRKQIAIQGRWLHAGESGIVVGKWLAEDLGLQLGFPVSISTRTRAGSYQVIDVDVVGIADSPNPNVNRSTVYLPLDLIDQQLEMKGDVTELVIGMPMGSNARKESLIVAEKLINAGFNVTVLPWQDLAADFQAISAAKQKSSGMIMVLVFIIAAVGISNTLLMAFYERKTEIGMLRALGMDNRALFWSFILEASGIGLIGSVIGLVLGALAVAGMVYIGLDFSFLMRKMDVGYRISGVFYGVWAPQSFVNALLLGLILPAFAAIMPTRRALKLPITESLRAE